MLLLTTRMPKGSFTATRSLGVNMPPCDSPLLSAGFRNHSPRAAKLHVNSPALARQNVARGLAARFTVFILQIGLIIQTTKYRSSSTNYYMCRAVGHALEVVVVVRVLAQLCVRSLEVEHLRAWFINKWQDEVITHIMIPDLGGCL